MAPEPGPRVVAVYAGSSFTKTVVSEEKDSNDTILKLYKHRFKLNVDSDAEELGMLRACKESRHVLVKMLPVRLPMIHSSKELRLGPHDVLSIENLNTLLEDLRKAHKHGLDIPSAIAQIPALVIFTTSYGEGTDLEDLEDAVHSGNDFQSCLPVFKGLHTLVLCCENPNILIKSGEGCFSEYTTNFDVNELSHGQNVIWAKAKKCERIFNNAMLKWKRKHDIDDLEIPEVKIMAKGWPVEQPQRLEENEDKERQ